MKTYTVRVWKALTVMAESIEEAEMIAVEQVWSDKSKCLWGSVVVSSWSDEETLEDINKDIEDKKNRKVLKLEDATVDQLLPLSWVHRTQGPTLYVARIGQNNDWAAYQGPAVWGVEGVANNGYKLLEEDAVPLFPVMAESGLTYRY